MADDIPKSKKLLVAFDPSRPDAGRGDFLVPVWDGNRVIFVGLRTKVPSELGLMIYLGKEVSVNDVFAKLVDSGQKILSVDQTVKTLGEYLTLLQDYRIGNVIAIEPNAAEPNTFQFVKIANTPSGATKTKE